MLQRICMSQTSSSHDIMCDDLETRTQFRSEVFPRDSPLLSWTYNTTRILTDHRGITAASTNDCIKNDGHVLSAMPQKLRERPRYESVETKSAHSRSMAMGLNGFQKHIVAISKGCSHIIEYVLSRSLFVSKGIQTGQILFARSSPGKYLQVVQ